jgi:hypothetical protein
MLNVPGKDRYGASATAVISASPIAKSGLLAEAQRSRKFTFIDPAVSEFDMLIAGPRPAVAAAFSSMQRCRCQQCTRN